MRVFLLFILLSFILTQTLAQDSLRLSKFCVYGSAGPNLYMNNFDRFSNFVEPVHYNFGVRIMWEPKSRMSIGLKTGYYRIYVVNFNGPDRGKFTLSAIPVQTFFAIRLYKGTYALFGMGPSVYYNTISTSKGTILNASYLSLADVSGGFGYLSQTSSKLSFGAEFEYFFSAKSNEHLLSLSFIMRLPL